MGNLHRAGATGVLELVEDRGRTHRLVFSHGLLSACELDGATTPLSEILLREGAVEEDVVRRSLLRAMASGRLHGDVLVRDFSVKEDLVEGALREQVSQRIHCLEQVPDARVHFRVASRVPRHALRRPLTAREFLSGRRRFRDRKSPSFPLRETNALRVLGLYAGASETEIKRAYRQLVRTCHPDLYPDATEAERRELSTRFREVTAAYRALTS